MARNISYQLMLEAVLTVITYLEYASLLLWLVAILTAVALWIKGILPALLRLGNGLAKRKIVIFAKNENLDSLKTLLADSRLFRGGNIKGVSTLDDMGAAENATLYLVYWRDWGTDIERILQQKKDGDALIVYAPDGARSIPDDKMKLIDMERNASVTNFRGRLLNDIVTAMITTSYK